jgi:hypothetical protein
MLSFSLLIAKSVPVDINIAKTLEGKGYTALRDTASRIIVSC